MVCSTSTPMEDGGPEGINMLNDTVDPMAQVIFIRSNAGTHTCLRKLFAHIPEGMRSTREKALKHGRKTLSRVEAESRSCKPQKHVDVFRLRT